MSPSASSSAPCTQCHGTGQRRRSDDTVQPCIHCDGRGHFDAPDFKAILKAIEGRKRIMSPCEGVGVIKALRTKRPDDSRAYFVWRMTRFHSGADVCMPMTAAFEISGDPYFKELNEFAASYAAALTGKGSIGSQRWHHAYGGPEPTDPEILNMPTYDDSKPYSELPETW